MREMGKEFNAKAQRLLCDPENRLSALDIDRRRI